MHGGGFRKAPRSNLSNGRSYASRQTIACSFSAGLFFARIPNGNPEKTIAVSLRRFRGFGWTQSRKDDIGHGWLTVSVEDVFR